VLAAMAAAHLGLGDRAKALAIAEEAIAVCRRRGARLYEFSALLRRIRALRQTHGLQVRSPSATCSIAITRENEDALGVDRPTELHFAFDVDDLALAGSHASGDAGRMPEAKTAELKHGETVH
jgi:hypothetical protein